MAYQIRSLDEIAASLRGAFRQYLPGTDASLKQNVLSVITKVLALLAHEYELRLQWIFRQLFLTTATSEAIILLHAAEYGVTRKPAAGASGVVSGTGSAHETYPAGIRFTSAGVNYITTESFTVNAVGDFLANVAAETGGAETNRDAGAQLLLADPSLYPSLSDTVTVEDGGIGGGADVEAIEDLRTRALKVKASPPQGGALADYENWALEVPGVVTAWSAMYSGGFGHIGVWVLFAGRENGIPTDSDLAAVDDHIADKRLVRARFSAAAPIAVPVDLEITLSPDTVAMRAAVTSALEEFFDARNSGARIRPGLPENPFILPRAWISEIVSSVPGETRHTLVAPEGDVVFQPGELPVLGEITWT